MADQVLQKTVEILDMWRFLEEAFDALSVSDQLAFCKSCASAVRFKGFDEITELDHLRIARFLIEKMNRFTRFKDRNLGLGLPTLANHERMLATFASHRHFVRVRNLDLAQLISICKMEQPHPISGQVVAAQ